MLGVDRVHDTLVPWAGLGLFCLIPIAAGRADHPTPM
jgi:hypothetical protein